MPQFTQANRLMRVQTALGGETLLLAELAGREGMSTPYHYRLTLHSLEPAIAPADMLRTPVTISLVTASGEERPIHGIVRRFVQYDRQDELTVYEADVVPRLWFLSLSRESRIYQRKSALEIVEEVLRAQGCTDLRVDCIGSYPKREYCVQYRETHLDFVSRLMEEEGIFYYFEHSDSGHTLVLLDSPSKVKACPLGGTARVHPRELADEDVVTWAYLEHSVHVGTVALKDYDPLQPKLSLDAEASGQSPGEEVYDFPGRYTAPEEGERYATLRLQAEEALRHVLRGRGNCRHFETGCSVQLEDGTRRELNGSFLITEVLHAASASAFRTDPGGPLAYQNEFRAIPMAVPYRPPRQTPRPLVFGSQTAVVVGPPGEEVHTDRYGRVKVQFHWDRQGKKDDGSSCWVRVASPWAGKGYGGVSIPRIGNEVIIQFLEGDPDRPVIIGSVYNADQMPPFELPGAGIQMGIKSRSSKGGGGYNEITVTDTKDTEQITIHGQYDMSTVVQHDQTTDIGNDRTETVGNDETITVHGNRTETVDKDEQISISGNRRESVSKNETISIGGDRKESVGKNETVDIGAARKVSVAKKDTLEVADARAVNITKDDKLEVGKKLSISAGDEIQLTTGSASITMKKDGTITIKGKDITVTGSGKVNIKASQDVTVKGSQIKQN